MSQAKWIWYHGDYELYHSMLLHARREEFGCEYPTFWKLSPPYPNVRFFKSYHADGDDVVRFVTRAKAYVMVDNARLPVNTDLKIGAGDHNIMVVLLATEGLPSLYVDSKYLKTDESWIADHMIVTKRVPVGCTPAYTSAEDNPEVFRFSYERLDPVKVTVTEQGTLYDFGRETYAFLCIEGADEADSIRVTYGESREEALDHAEALIKQTVSGKNSYRLAGRAFRYVCVQGGKNLKIWADYEYLPLEDVATFSCNRKNVNKIWDICAYTLHLNSREFFLDGIKRDRWCWSGDAYQSYMANRYLYFDPEITKRTIIALLGKPPYEQHINSINDYSMYLIIGAYEYYFATGDARFIEIYFDRLQALYDFIVGRLDENGYVCYRDGDWIFIDWSDMDKGGPLCAEQILLWQCRKCMAELCALVGKDGTVHQNAADALQKRIIKDYWREDRGAFVDCYTTGRENVTRHANIFAIMYGFVSHRRAQKIVRCVLENDAVNQITTPYFEFFELNALCMMGRLKTAQEKIESYWGGMVSLGATSIWEQYLPEQKGIEHFGMYGMKYGCSLCHAWGGGPIYLLGRYCLGVYPTSVGYETFTVQPDRGLYRKIEGTVPLPEGHSVHVCMDAHTCTVTATRGGGTLVLGKQAYEIPESGNLTITF